MPSPNPQSRWRLVKLLGTALMMIATAAAILLYVARNWRVLAEYQWAFVWSWAVAAAGLMFIFCVAVAVGWFVLVKWTGVVVSPIDACWAWSRSSLTRYLPTPIWLTGSRIYLTMQLGVSWRGSSVSFAAELIGTIAAAATIALLAAPAWLDVPPILVVALVVVMVVAILPMSYQFLLHFLGQHSTFNKSSSKTVVGWSCLYAGGFLVYGIAHMFAFRSVSSVELPLGLVLGVSAFAWAIGTLNVFSPSGIGTREAILIFGFRDYLDMPVLLAMGIVARLVFLLGELLLFGLLWLLTSIRSRKLQSTFRSESLPGPSESVGVEL